MKSRLVILPLLSTLVLGACANMSETQRNTAIGAGIGALGGAVISKSTGGNKTGRDAAIGAGVGALGGYVWSQRMEAQRQAMAQAAAGTGRRHEEYLFSRSPAPFFIRGSLDGQT